MSENSQAVGAPVEASVRPRAWADDKVMAGQVGNCASDAAKNYWLRSNQFDRMMAERLTHPLYAMPPELADYLLRHLLRKRAALDGFLRLGNEKSRAKRLDAWIACLAGPNVGIEPPYSVGSNDGLGPVLPERNDVDRPRIAEPAQSGQPVRGGRE